MTHRFGMDRAVGRVAFGLLLAVMTLSLPVHAQSTSSGVFTSSDVELAPMMRLGRVVDAAGFSHRREVRLYPSRAGVSRYPLTVADIAHAAPDLRDIRLVDGKGRQASFIIVPGREEQIHAKVIPDGTASARSARRGGQSPYVVQLPHVPIRLLKVALDVESAFVERDYRLYATAPSDRLLAAGTLRGEDADGDIDVPVADPDRVGGLRLVIDDGDDAPLIVGGVTLTVEVADLVVVAPSGSYRLLLGNPKIGAPRYELAARSDHLLAAPAGQIHAGPLEPNPARVVDRGDQAVPHDEALWLWAAIGLSVLILGAVTLRAARSGA